MKTIVQELFEKMSSWYCYYAMQKENHPNEHLYAALATGAHTQMMLCYRYLHNELTDDKFANELNGAIETFLKTAEKVALKEGREAEKIAVRMRDSAKMMFMILSQHIQKKNPIKKAYSCQECGWVGMDEIPEKCPLCGKRLI